MGVLTPSEFVGSTHLDTHILVWLYQNPQRVWPTPVKALLDNGTLRYSPIVKLELAYLNQIGRIRPLPDELLEELSEPLQLSACDQPFSLVVEQALHLIWTRDPFDRLIVGQAKAAGAKLITHDETIRSHFSDAVWDTL